MCFLSFQTEINPARTRHLTHRKCGTIRPDSDTKSENRAGEQTHPLSTRPPTSTEPTIVSGRAGTREVRTGWRVWRTGRTSGDVTSDYEAASSQTVIVKRTRKRHSAVRRRRLSLKTTAGALYSISRRLARVFLRSLPQNRPRTRFFTAIEPGVTFHERVQADRQRTLNDTLPVCHAEGSGDRAYSSPPLPRPIPPRPGIARPGPPNPGMALPGPPRPGMARPGPPIPAIDGPRPRPP